ncbi:UNVERIFIED_CONTAM: hypothetical protein HDU68_011627 [Siphonaria sp. JEL0065]|nr:hypothetical protein HDU68_011627 [Siphonaria sp. JEL0065]
MDIIRSRLSQASTLRSSILRASPVAASSTVKASVLPAATSTVKPSLGAKMLNYHNPDVCLLGLSNQDASLSALGLKDQWLESRLLCEQEFVKRGKTVKVGVLSGRAPKPTDKDGKKKKKK